MYGRGKSFMEDSGEIFLNKTNNLEGVNAYWKIILRRDKQKSVVRLCFKIIWLKIRIGGAFL
jgi:hypothetical protein